MLRDLAAEIADGHGLLVALGGIGDPVVPQRVVERDDAAGTQEAERLLEVGGVLDLVAVAEHDVVVAVSQPGEHVERGAGDRAHALVGNAGLRVGLAGQSLVLRLDVDRRQDSVAAHPAQQPHARDAGARADLDDRASVEHRGEEAERRAAARADGRDPDLLGAGPGRFEDLVLGDVGLRVGPGSRLGRAGGHVADPSGLRAPRTAGNTGPRQFVGHSDARGSLSGSSQDPSLP